VFFFLFVEHQMDDRDEAETMTPALR